MGDQSADAHPAILVVDDEEEFLNTYRRLFGRQKLRVVTAATCEAALAALALEPFALVIADLRLPDGDGLDIVRRARATARPTPTSWSPASPRRRRGPPRSRRARRRSSRSRSRRPCSRRA